MQITKQKFNLEIKVNVYNDLIWTEDNIRTAFIAGSIVEEAKLLSVKELK